MPELKQPPSQHLKEVAEVFLRLGFTAFGGPAAHIAMMREQIVKRRGWVSETEFLDLLSASNLIPGPSSTELAIHLGFRRAGWRGLVIGGFCFILPAALIVSAFAWAYVRFGNLPAIGALFWGVKPVIIAVVAQAIWNFAKASLKSVLLIPVCLAGILANAAGVGELPVILGAGLTYYCLQPRRAKLSVAPLLAFWGSATALSFTNAALFFFFLKIGSVVFGSGYVLLAFLRADLVENWHWLTETQLLDAVAVGQFTPGPVFTTATFIGYLLSGPVGALLATIAIFVPAFVFVFFTSELVAKMRKSASLAQMLDGINAGSLAIMTVTIAGLAKNAIVDVPTLLIAAVSFALLLRLKLNSAWLVLAGGVTGWLHSVV